MTARESERDYVRRMERRVFNPATQAVASTDLRASDLPPPGAGWQAISACALTLPRDLYSDGDFARLDAVVNAVAGGAPYADALPADLDGLRVILHAHQRRIRWLEREPPDLPLCRAILRRMRRLVRAPLPPTP